MKYKRILFPTDGSATSKKTLTHVIAMAKGFGSEVIVLCVYQQPYTVNLNMFTLPKDIYEKMRIENDTNSRKIVDEVIHELVINGIECYGVVLEGNSKKLICEKAISQECDLIIMGTRGHSEMSNYLGSTSSYVINNTKNIPVLVVG
ncbi:MAG: universal stress protein [Cyanobacteriota bacterium]